LRLRLTRIRDKKMEEEVLKQRALQGDPEAEYELAFYYYQRGDYPNTVRWFGKIIANQSHPYYREAVCNLAEIYEYVKCPGISEEESIDRAVRMYSSMNSFFAKFHLSLIYCEDKYGKYNPVEVKKMLETGIKKLISDDGNDEYLKQIECFRIGIIYYKGKINVNKRATDEELQKSMEYLNKTIARCDDRYQYDRGLKEKAVQTLDCAKNRLEISIDGIWTKKDIERDIQICEANIKKSCEKYMKYEEEYLHKGIGNADRKAELYFAWKNLAEREQEQIKQLKYNLEVAPDTN